jgi:SulP family sulfate permease
MTAIDGTGLRAIQDFADSVHGSGRTLLLCGALPQPSRLMSQAEFHHHVGAENILPNVNAALARWSSLEDRRIREFRVVVGKRPREGHLARSRTSLSM